jgi:hypothetical protein
MRGKRAKLLRKETYKSWRAIQRNDKLPFKSVFRRIKKLYGSGLIKSLFKIKEED